jgi:hypothetical protein
VSHHHRLFRLHDIIARTWYIFLQRLFSRLKFERAQDANGQITKEQLIKEVNQQVQDRAVIEAKV